MNLTNTIYYRTIVFIILVFLSSKYIFKDKVPNVFGYSIFRVVSGSMGPNIKIGDFVIIKKSDDYEKGDIVSYIDENNNLVTHRIKEINEYKVITKGDANNTVDPEIYISSIQGKVIFKFHDIFLSRKRVILILFGLFIIGGIITMILPNRKK